MGGTMTCSSHQKPTGADWSRLEQKEVARRLLQSTPLGGDWSAATGAEIVTGANVRKDDLAMAREEVAAIQRKARDERVAAGLPAIEIYSLNDFLDQPDPPRYFTFDQDVGAYRIFWGGYDYEWDYDKLDSPIAVLQMLVHIGGKGWELATPERIAELVEDICQRRDWDVHACQVLASRENTDAEERAKITPRLRWSVLKRDGFACRACGANASTGAVLHLDHIQPVTKGGRSIADNLQTLCSVCNFGKGAE